MSDKIHEIAAESMSEGDRAWAALSDALCAFVAQMDDTALPLVLKLTAPDGVRVYAVHVGGGTIEVCAGPPEFTTRRVVYLGESDPGGIAAAVAALKHGMRHGATK